MLFTNLLGCTIRNFGHLTLSDFIILNSETRLKRYQTLPPFGSNRPINFIMSLMMAVFFIDSPILERLNINVEQWLTLTTEFEKHFSTAVGSEHMLQQFKQHTDHSRIRGMAKARALLQSA
jgi:hypothetical protein